MPPPGGDDSSTRRPSHLRMVTPTPAAPAAPTEGAEVETAAPPTTSSAPPASERISLPPRYADASSLLAFINGHGSRTPYASTISALGELANPRPLGGYEVSFSFRNTVYQILQETSGAPIGVNVTQERGGNTVELLRMVYHPDGLVSSHLNPEPHASPTGVESTHHRILQRSILTERAQRVLFGQDLYVRLRTALEALRGRYTPETQSVWYDSFVVNKNHVYTFRIRNLLGLPGVMPNPQSSQISIYEEGGANRLKILTLSATGENNWEPSRPDREPLSPQLLESLKRLVEPLERARVNPEAYERELHTALTRWGGSAVTKLPQITRSVDVQQAFAHGRGPRGEPILEIRRGWDLFRNFHPWATHRWENPENPQDVRHLSPRWRLSLRMGRELMRWVGRTANYGTFGNLKSPRPVPDLLRLQLFPEGGGQITLFREGNIHDILIAGARGPVWRASREIARMNRKGVVFENRVAALQAAVAARGTGAALPDPIEVQTAPFLDLDKVHIGPDGNPIKIMDVETAWRQLQLQIPEGVHPRVRSGGRETLASVLLPHRLSVIDRIDVDFRESQPFQRLELRHQDISTSSEGPPIRRVEMILRSGENTHARVFEDGDKRPDIEHDIHRRLLLRAQEGNMPTSRLALLAQAIPRLYGYYKTSGATYGLSYFIALPVTLGFERLYLTEGERRLVGTPMPSFSLRYFIRDFSLPFMTLSTVSGATGVAIDGLYNLRPGLASTVRMWRAGATLTEAYRLSRPSFLNEFPHIRPVGSNYLFRGLLQRAVPLFAGLVALEYLHHGGMNWTRFRTTAINVGMTSAGSAALLRGIYSSERLAGFFVRRGWIEDTLRGAALAEEGAAAGSAARSAVPRMLARTAGESRYALTFRGGIWFAAAELIALGILQAHDKRQWVAQMEGEMRSQVGDALDRRNELITRLEHGEEVSPRVLVAADQELQNAQGAYRRFLELMERGGGTGDARPLTLANDFADAYATIDHGSLLGAETSSDPMLRLRSSAARLASDRRLDDLRGRYDRMESDLRALYARHGMPASASSEPDESLRDFLTRTLAAAESSGAAAGTESSDAPAIVPPVPVDSAEGRAITEQLRWKASQDPSFLFAAPERRATYILRQFRGYRVTEADGSSRPWRMDDALAFLGAVEQANAERSRNLGESLTMPQRAEGHDTARLEALLGEEREIRSRERATHTHARGHAEILSRNVADFDRQMADYYRLSNARLGTALEAFMDPGPAVAMGSGDARGAELASGS